MRENDAWPGLRNFGRALHHVYQSIVSSFDEFTEDILSVVSGFSRYSY